MYKKDLVQTHAVSVQAALLVWVRICFDSVDLDDLVFLKSAILSGS